MAFCWSIDVWIGSEEREGGTMSGYTCENEKRERERDR